MCAQINTILGHHVSNTLAIQTHLLQTLPFTPFRYASHVLQTLVTRTALIVKDDDTPDPASLEAIDMQTDEVPDTVTAATLLDHVCRQFQHYLGDYLVSQYVDRMALLSGTYGIV